MAIVWDPKRNLINIETKSSTYQMKIDKYQNLIHTFYGAKIGDTDMSQELVYMDRGFSGNPYEAGKDDRKYSLDYLPQEYSCFGTGDYRITGLQVKEAGGNKTCSLHYKDHRIEKGLHSITGLPAIHSSAGDNDNYESLCVTLEDEVNGLIVELWYSIIDELDIIGRNVELKNNGKDLLTIEKAASVNLDIPFGDYQLIRFTGRHAMERNFTRSDIEHGITSLGSVRGTSSHHYHPFSIVCDRHTTETHGGCYGFSFLYSGEYLTEIEKDQTGGIRFLMGIHPNDFEWLLEVGEDLCLPQVLLTYSDEGLGQLSRNYHKAINRNIVRGKWNSVRRPVLINNWEATYFDFTGEKLVEIATEAHDMGVELFVMDDGWFGKRDDDNSGLGDWFANEEKLGCTLRELGEKITATGMQFGVWFEPEMVSEDSDLYRNHPDWAVQSPGRKPALGRNQLVLDYANPDVCDYMIARLGAILLGAPISYVKWDMNRSICDKYSNYLDVAHQGEFAHRYVLGLYRVLETLTQQFENVLFEGCSGGGGRFDAGMMYYTPQIWLSDNTDAINRLSIQYGSSFGYPVSTMGAHVSASPNHQTGRNTPLKTRSVVAMAGTFGYELDITKMTSVEKDQVREQISTFQRLYHIIQQGDYYRLSTPDDSCTVWSMVTDDKSEALISAVYHNVEANQLPTHLSIPGLDPYAHYDICYLNDEFEYSNISTGQALLNGGLSLRPSQTDFDSVLIYLKKC